MRQAADLWAVKERLWRRVLAAVPHDDRLPADRARAIKSDAMSSRSGGTDGRPPGGVHRVGDRPQLGQRRVGKPAHRPDRLRRRDPGFRVHQRQHRRLLRLPSAHDRTSDRDAAGPIPMADQAFFTALLG